MAIHERSFQSAVSTDMLGYFAGSAKKFRSLIPSEFTVSHAEVVGWGPTRWLKRFVSELAQEGVQVADFHGRTGVENRAGLLDTAKIIAVTPFLLSTPKLIDTFPKHSILVHVPEAARKSVTKAIIARKPHFVWVENHAAGENGLNQAKTLVRFYRANGVRSAVMFDGCHYIGAENLLSGTQFRKHWDRMNAARQHYLIQGEHVPISNIANDGYPMAHISQNMWKEYALQKSRNLRWRVIENQQPEHLAGVAEKYISAIVKRNSAVYSVLQKTGVTCFE